MGRWYVGGDPNDANNPGVPWDGPGPPVPTWVIVAVVIVVALGALSLVTGVPGPGPLRRYPMAELNDTAERINRAAASSSAAAGVRSTGEPSEPARVDLWRSRVQVSTFAQVCTIGLSSDEVAMIVVGGSDDPPRCGT